MNSERRHELQQNDLAVYLNKINKAIEPYSKLIAIAVGVLIVGGIAYGFYRSEQTGLRSEATLQLIQAGQSQDPEVYLTVSDIYPNTAAGDVARLYQGQLYLSQGIQGLFSDRETAEELLNDAQQALAAAISGSKDKLLRSRGQYGIACAAEALGNLDQAIEEYKKVIEINESEAMVKKAQERIDDLSKPETKSFVSWFADQDFSPADPSLPPSLPGRDSLPDVPEFKLPPLNLGAELNPGTDAEGAPRDLEGGIELPGDDAAPMSEEATLTEEATEIVLPESSGDAAASDAAAGNSTAGNTTAGETPAEASEQPASETNTDEDGEEK